MVTVFGTPLVWDGKKTAASVFPLADAYFSDMSF